MTVESGNFCVSNDFADRSFLSHWAFTVVSSAVEIAASANTGAGVDPSKCPQKPLVSMASWNLKMKIAQFIPKASSLGTDNGRASESEAIVIVDMVSRFVVQRAMKNNLLSSKTGAHNLLKRGNEKQRKRRIYSYLEYIHVATHLIVLYAIYQ